MSYVRDYIRAAMLLLLAVDVQGVCADEASAPQQGDAPRGAYMATQCVRAAQCPLFDEVYAATPSFRHALALNLRHGDQTVPEWVKDKLPRQRLEQGSTSQGTGAPMQSTPTASPMLPLRIDDRSYLIGQMSDPQDPRHRIVALYDTLRGFATLYYIDRDAKAVLLGDTQELLRKVMSDYLNSDSDFARSLSRPDVSLPVPVRGQ